MKIHLSHKVNCSFAYGLPWLIVSNNGKVCTKFITSICLNSNLFGFLVGAIVGTVVGAMKGQTTESGFFRGAEIGAVAGAITAVQLMESLANGESLSKV